MAASVEAAVAAKLKATAAVTAVVAGRVYPQLDTQEAAFPQIVYTKLGADDAAGLGGSSGLPAYTVRVDCYAETELAAVALGLLVRAALDGWQDKAAGVHGGFFLDSVGEVTETGVRFQGETFTIRFRPRS